MIATLLKLFGLMSTPSISQAHEQRFKRLIFFLGVTLLWFPLWKQMSHYQAEIDLMDSLKAMEYRRRQWAKNAHVNNKNNKKRVTGLHAWLDTRTVTYSTNPNRSNNHNNNNHQMDL
mmetsp:Transcript_991/g.2771  ORF Transcript_991/g.2771 Transcript_991/m.2771 type:complete len:117 (+) Transcript_991:156-506(+)|eukprot:CAMPEP_0168743324 /NCGR_PEP_ID=MMETSP0724-20121128/13515_1 /TAXON_ID=265536 /ORGANISM="Amphiprora sp., Strain CCMP467" /LENGTH=116 /DNA_ID=CAMNT_0008790945 /DNA_START=56 /DNA_END=406 /DNA_ORIENTATION=-